MDLLLESTHRVETRHFWFRGLRRFLPPLVARAARGRRDAMLLDCGSGTGVNLPLLARFGRVAAVDLSRFGLGLAREAGFTRAARASVARLPFRDESFDVATSIDVLYCLQDGDERRAVNEMYRVLRPGGGAVFNLAAMRILRGNHSVLAAEVRRYDRARVRALLASAGFRIERLTYAYATTFPLTLAQRLMERTVGLATPDGAAQQLRVPSPPLNELLAAMLAVESAVLRVASLPFGSSLLCLARKPVNS
jgi:ubiquinone/menaquinone biosynthesis C-methylase UbiE